LWNKVQRAFLNARAGAERMVNGVLFSHSKTVENKCQVDVTLPSGRVIHYPDVRVAKHLPQHMGRPQWVYGQGKGKKLYGGLLVENIVQAMSRDILAEAIYVMEQEGHPVAYHIHDSVVCGVSKKQAAAVGARCAEVLSVAPDWAPGMRLGAETAIEESFA
jgi:DNA polymerase